MLYHASGSWVFDHLGLCFYEVQQFYIQISYQNTFCLKKSQWFISIWLLCLDFPLCLVLCNHCLYSKSFLTPEKLNSLELPTIFHWIKNWKTIENKMQILLILYTLTRTLKGYVNVCNNLFMYCSNEPKIKKK